jgi:hypothetical protein
LSCSTTKIYQGTRLHVLEADYTPRVIYYRSSNNHSVFATAIVWGTILAQSDATSQKFTTNWYGCLASRSGGCCARSTGGRIARVKPDSQRCQHYGVSCEPSAVRGRTRESTTYFCPALSALVPATDSPCTTHVAVTVTVALTQSVARTHTSTQLAAWCQPPCHTPGPRPRPTTRDCDICTHTQSVAHTSDTRFEADTSHRSHHTLGTSTREICGRENEGE